MNRRFTAVLEAVRDGKVQHESGTWPDTVKFSGCTDDEALWWLCRDGYTQLDVEKTVSLTTEGVFALYTRPDMENEPEHKARIENSKAAFEAYLKNTFKSVVLREQVISPDAGEPEDIEILIAKLHHAKIQLAKAIAARQASKPATENKPGPFAWPGGGDIFAACSRCGILHKSLCPECARLESQSKPAGWHISAVCQECGKEESYHAKTDAGHDSISPVFYDWRSPETGQAICPECARKQAEATP